MTPLLGFLYTTIAALVIIPMCAAATMLSRYGWLGCVYLVSAWTHALADAERARRVIAAEYRRRALAQVPRGVIEVAPRKRRRKLGTGGRLLRKVGKLMGGRV